MADCSLIAKSATEPISKRDENCQHGWAWFPDSSTLAASRSCCAPENVATLTYADSWCRGPPRHATTKQTVESNSAADWLKCWREPVRTSLLARAITATF